MSVGAFISLSLHYAEAAKSNASTEFLQKRIIRDYDRLDVAEKLRLFSVIDHQNYSIYRPHFLRNITDAEFLETLESDVHLLNALGYPKMAGNVPKMPFSGCVPVYVALELANVPDPHAIAADPQAPYPV